MLINGNPLLHILPLWTTANNGAYQPQSPLFASDCSCPAPTEWPPPNTIITGMGCVQSMAAAAGNDRYVAASPGIFSNVSQRVFKETSFCEVLTTVDAVSRYFQCSSVSTIQWLKRSWNITILKYSGWNFPGVFQLSIQTTMAGNGSLHEELKPLGELFWPC